MSDVVTGGEVPSGYGSLNPFVAVQGSGGAPAFISFVEEVFEGKERLAAHTVDADDLLIHAEIVVGDSTLMCCDAKPDWPFTPALLQLYVNTLDPILERASRLGAEVFTEPTDFFGGQRLARFLDPWHNVWWLFEHGPQSSTPADAPDELPEWKPDPDAPPSYVHQTICDRMSTLGPPDG